MIDNHSKKTRSADSIDNSDESCAEYLKEWELSWKTSLGCYFPGQRAVLNGQDLFTDLKDLDWFGVLLFGVTGEKPSKNLCALLSGIWAISTSYPDPRLWNNRIATLAATARSTGALGVSAGIAVSEAVVYGQQPLLGAAHLLSAIHKGITNGHTISALLDRRLADKSPYRPASGKRRAIASIPGFGRPVSSRDERVKPLLDLVKKLNFDGGEYVALAFAIEADLLNRGLEKMYLNVAGLMAALMCDQNITPEQQYYLWTLCFSAGIVNCAADASRQPEGRFFPIRCTRIHYNGPASRKWARLKR